MLAEFFLLSSAALLAVVFLFRKDILQFIEIVKFSRTLKGPSIREVIENSSKERVLPFFLATARKYGSRFCLWLSIKCFVFVTDPEDAKIVLSSQELLYKSNNYELVNPWLGNGILTAGGPKWQRARKLLTPAFHFNVLRQFKGAMTECNNILIDRLESECTGEPVDIYPFVTLFALDVICETALGVKKNAQVNSTSAYVSAVKEICAIMHHRSFNVWLRINWIFRLSRMYQRQQQLLQILHGETNAVIRERREMIKRWDLKQVLEETSGSYYEGSKRRLAFLDMLLIAQLEGKEITDAQIREEVDTFMFEGHDTTSSAISFAIYLLSLDDKCQQRAYEEAVEYEGREQENMKYLEAVIKETLRLYPSVPFYSRKVMKSFQLGDLTLPPGTTVNIMTYALQRNPDVFPNPETFRPERYLKEEQLHPFSNVAFSAGPRNCIGQKFAMLEMKCTLAGLLRHFRFREAVGVPKPLLLAELILKSGNGVHVVLEKRN